MLKVNGRTKIVGLMGHPVSHSVSPEMHNAAFEALNINFCYIPIPVESEDLKKALDGIRALKIVGVNVTIPHKEAIIPLLDEVTKLPRLMGAVNTILNQDGKLIGYNTDGPGFVDSLKSDAKVDPKGKKVVVLGAGGASKAVSIMLAEAGARSLVITDIIIEKAENLAEYVKSHFEIESTVCPVESRDLQSSINECNILVNTTPVGMHPKVEASPLPDGIKIPSGIQVCDLIYNPPETKFLKIARESGAKTLNGIGMLVRQGALSFSIFTGKDAPVDIMKKAALEALNLI